MNSLCYISRRNKAPIGLMPIDAFKNSITMNNKIPSTKICTKCGNKKYHYQYSKDKRHSDGLMSRCKTCRVEDVLLYGNTINGVVTRIYSDQIAMSKKRKYPPPNYTKNELAKWIKNQSSFQNLWNNWVKSGYLTKLKPSCDRLDDYKPYSLNNLRLITWGKNHNKAYLDRRNGINNKHSKAVIGINRKTREIVEHYSISEASRVMSIQLSSISKACKGMQKTAGGYKWKYKNTNK